MFKHLFKLIWNKKKQNFLLICEMLVSFMVIFAVFSMIVNYYQNFKKPMGLEYNDVWVINYQNNKQFKTTDSALLYYETVRNILQSMPQIKDVSFAPDNVPFTNSSNMTGFTYKGRKFNSINTYREEIEYLKIFNIKVLEGRWFNKNDQAAIHNPVVINESLRKQLFGDGKALGQAIGDDTDKKKMHVIGVVNDIKDKGDYHPSGTAIYYRTDTSAYQWQDRILLKVSPSADAAFESKLYKTVTNAMKDASIEIEHFSKMREHMNKNTLIPIIIFLTIAAFLIINVALGLFGVLWYNINKRRGEIGLRRAIGATGYSVSAQMVTESMLLATLSLIVGTFFAIQFPLLHVFDLPAGVYIIALFLAILFIYLLVLVCSLYPGRQAANVYPAVALHEE